MEKKTESNYLKNKNLVLLIPAILVINTIYSFIFLDGLGINNLFEFSTFLVFLSKINPLFIPVHLAYNLISPENWMGTFINPQHYFQYYGGFSIFNIFSLLISYPRIFLIPVVLFFGWPILALTMIKRVQSEAEPIPTGLTISEIIKNSFSLGLNNKGLIIGASILWALTAWIPYLNVGTTISFLGIIVLISKGDSASATEIFNAKYRKNMGEFFLLLSFMIIGTAIGYAFVIIPGIVISIAWSQSILLFIDKGYSPLESIKKSNDITYGEKLTIFIGYLSLVLILGLSIGLLITLAGNVHEIFALLVGLFGYIAFILVMIGCTAYIYGELNKKLK
jgi:hypothetical protein|tara:strand:- start:7121 stop:8128 length:1008 start_codon:yes stop_codon:yes gene_type:complete